MNIDLTNLHLRTLRSILTDYVETHLSETNCSVCKAKWSDHKREDCPVKVAVELLEELDA